MVSCYSSDLKRAHKTAEIIATKLEVPVITDERIREAYGGQIEGTTKAERIERWGEKWYEEDLGIENNKSVVERGLAFINEIVDQHPEKHILVISHGSFLRQLLAELVEPVSQNNRLNNTSLTKLHYDGQKWEISLFNCTKHLN